MSSYSVLCKSALLLIIFAGFLAETCYGGPEDEPDCQYLKNIVEVVSNQVVQIAACAVENNFGTPALQALNYFCIAKCALTKLQVLNENGSPNIEGVMKFVDTGIPPSLKPETRDLVTQCSQAAVKVVGSVGLCNSYEPLISCVYRATTTVFGKVVSTVAKSGSGPAKIFKCGTLPARVESELKKLDLKFLRGIN